jgi:RNA polymerase-interacting CarD/CdnL/TRCF family regulator
MRKVMMMLENTFKCKPTGWSRRKKAANYKAQSTDLFRLMTFYSVIFLNHSKRTTNKIKLYQSINATNSD